MMKLRTKSQNLSLSDEQTPSTSSASATFVHSGMRRLSTNSNDQHSSPDSPVIGRIAKSNARILNGLDLNDVKRSGMCVDVFGILPELKVDELNADKYPNIYKLLAASGSRKPPLDVDNLQLVQHELEELISLNVDCQKTIHGEITYLTTGEYPTSDLSKRLMPKYALNKRKELHQEHRAGDQNSDRESFTNFLIELGLLSSPEEEEEPPSILDVPNRFWTWAKEYLGPVSKATLREYKQKVLDRFMGERYTSRFAQSKMALTTTSKTTPPAAVSTIKKSHKRKAADALCHHSASAEQSPTKKMLKLDKSLSTESLVVPLTAAKTGAAIRQQLLNNGGIVSTKNGIILDKIMPPLTPPLPAAATATNTPATIAAVEKDEVVAELQKKQQQLKVLYEQTRPVVEQLYGRLRAEYAVHQVFNRLDSADNSLLQMGSKYKRLPFFTAEQRHEVEQALSAHAKVYRIFHGQRENE